MNNPRYKNRKTQVFLVKERVKEYTFQKHSCVCNHSLLQVVRPYHSFWRRRKVILNKFLLLFVDACHRNIKPSLKIVRRRVISQFTVAVWAWADKGHLYQKGKTHRDEYWICAHESYVTLFINAPTVHSKIRKWKYSFQEGKKKGIHEAHLGLWQLLF